MGRKDGKVIESTMEYSEAQIAVMAKYADDPPRGTHLSSLSNLEAYRNGMYCIFTKETPRGHWVVDPTGALVTLDTSLLINHEARIRGLPRA